MKSFTRPRPRPARPAPTSSASGSARPARSIASAASSSSRRISDGRTSRCAIAVSAASICRRRSTTTPTARRSANGGAAPRKACDNVVGITIGTGIGGGLILDGELYHGASDVAGEVGHTTIDSDRSPLQVRQLWMPRGVRVGTGDRRARRAKPCLGGEASLLRDHGRGRPDADHGAHVYEAATSGRPGRPRGRPRDGSLPRHRRRESR